MENAGLNATTALLDHLHQHQNLTPPDIRAIILCGGGNNGGDGFVIARHLHNRGAAVTIDALKDPADLTGDAATNHEICRRMGLSIEHVLNAAQLTAAAARWGEAHVVVDALLGTGFRGEVRQPMAQAIEAINALAGPVIMAVDVPSGLDCEQGMPTHATVRADLTVTFAAAKTAFFTDAARPYLGTLAVADIGAPPELLDRV